MPMQNKHARDWLAEQVEHVILLEGYDDAIIGIATRSGSEPVVVYSRPRIIEICVIDGMTHEDAEVWVSCKVERRESHVGVLTPWIMTPIPKPKRRSKASEVTQLRAALTAIAENKDEPYARDFARDILANREVP